MIEIKNKRMILFPEDRIIGAEGDIKTATRRFVMDGTQSGYDLSDMIAIIKLEPVGTGESPYNQLLSKEVSDGRIILTWTLSGANLKSAGELSAQIMLISKGYFKESDLEGLSNDDLVVPSIIEGVSAPVWQSFKETFIIAQSIDDTVVYSEVTKNVLNAAVADAVYSAEQSAISAENANSALKSVSEKASYVDNIYSAVQNQVMVASDLASQARIRANEAEEYSEKAKGYSSDAKGYSEEALRYNQDAISCVSACVSWSEQTQKYSKNALNSEEVCIQLADECNVAAMEAKNTAQSIKDAKKYRLLYSKALTVEDEGCISFEINKDDNGESFNLSEFAFYIYIPKMEDVGGTYLRVDAIGEGNGVFSPMVQFIGISRTDNQYLRVGARNMGRWICDISKHTSLSANIESNTNFKSVCTQQRRTDGKCVTAVRLEQHTSVGLPFPEGTSVELWGLDMPA